MPHQKTVNCVKRFFRLVKTLRFKVTIYDLMESEGLTRRQIIRWVNLIDEMIGIEKTPQGSVRAPWTYQIRNRHWTTDVLR